MPRDVATNPTGTEFSNVCRLLVFYMLVRHFFFLWFRVDYTFFFNYKIRKKDEAANRIHLAGETQATGYSKYGN